jgi:hypothetical protein
MRVGGGQQRMTASGPDGHSAPRAGSLLSLAPQATARRAPKPVLNPMLAALARSPQPSAGTARAAVAEEQPAARPNAAEEAPAAGESMASPEPVEPPLEPPAAESGNSVEDGPAETQQRETAKNLVARLRRQFMEGLPEGRPEAGGASTGSADPKRQAAPRRSPIEEVRFRLSEFRTEILVRAAGRAKPSRRE